MELRMNIRSLLGVITAAMLAASAASAQTIPGEVSYKDDFQSYGTQKNPPGWVDTSIGSSKPVAGGLYKTWPDPLVSGNVVYGTKQGSGNPDGSTPRIGTFSTLTTKTFSAKGRFEYRGRFIRTNAETRIGLTVLSAYPEKDQYYLVGTWGARLTMQLHAFGAGTLAGKTDSEFTPEPNKWYHFLVQVDDTADTTFIRARFWPDGTDEAKTFSIDAKDPSASRLTAGRIGLWSAVKGDAYVDDLVAKSPVDHTPPVIALADADTGKVLEPAALALFKQPARIEIRVTDDLSAFTYTAKLDGADYVSAAAVTKDGMHKLAVTAVDSPGNTASASLEFLVDQLPPQVTIKANGAALTDGEIFDKDVQITAEVSDISTTKTTARLNGAEVGLPLAVSEERQHQVTISSTDQVGWETTVTRSLTVDKAAPVIEVLGNDKPLLEGASFRQATLVWKVSDLTLDQVTATLDGQPVTSGLTVTSELPAPHKLIIRATDKAGHAATVERSFVVRNSAPEVNVLANGVAVKEGAHFNKAVAFTLKIIDTTATSTVLTLDEQPYEQGTSVTAAGKHTLKAVVTNAVELSTTVTIPFVVDYNAPSLTLTESNQPFTDAMKFARDITPVATATDDFTEKPQIVLLIDGREHTSGQPFAEEKAEHTIEVSATDLAGNKATAGPFRFALDKTRPVVTITDNDGNPFAPDALFNRPVVVKVRVADVTDVTLEGKSSGQPLPFGSPQRQSDGSVVFTTTVTTDAKHEISAVATDLLGHTNDPVRASFTIDTIPPAITFTDPQPEAIVATPSLRITGGSDDAVNILINGVRAAIDLTAKTFAIEDVALLEGRNEISVVATDKAGNAKTTTLVVQLDTRAPEIAVAQPASGSCLSATEITVGGRAADPNLREVTVSLGGSAVPATGSSGTFTAALPLPNEGKITIVVTATDAAGHGATATIPLTVDRTRPVIEVTAAGAPFAGGSINRPLALFLRAIDADPSTVITATLNGSPYLSGTQITADGPYVLRALARDCAGNVSEERTIEFAIDTVAPKFLSIDPVSGTRIGTRTATIRGTFERDDTRTLRIEESGVTASLSGTSFTFTDVPLGEGTNRLTFVAADAAGNETRYAYEIGVKSTAPAIEIVENGAPIPSNALYNRAVTPLIRVSEPDATVAATLNGAAWTPATITAEGTYTLTATATDPFGHKAEAAASFTIDTTPPGITIASPANGALLTADRTEVRLTVTGSDIAAVSINGVAVSADLTATIPLDLGSNTIAATATDRAGNAAVARIEVTRDDGRPGIIITTPQDNARTNRPAIVVSGQVLTPGTTTVVLGGVEVATDSAGVFRRTDVALTEGPNAIKASVKGTSTTATVNVFADFTPPALKVLAGDRELIDGDRFPTAPACSVQASDNTPEGLTTRLIIDGTDLSGAPAPAPALTDGGHSLVAIARDAAGNETRLERTFFIGTAIAAGCSISEVDPPSLAAFASGSVQITGRSGGAAGVRINGTPATVAGGSFCGSVALGQEGANEVTIECTDSSGAPLGSPVKLTYFRYSGAPSIAIAAPASDAVITTEKVTVSGTVSTDVVEGDVNGISFRGASTFSVDVPLARGLNVIAARARNGAGRVTTTSVQVRRLAAAPSITITSPLPSVETGASSIDVSGTWQNIDPATLSGARALTDTSGTFTTSVPLAVGPNTIRVAGRNRAGVEASATVTVIRIDGDPSISITAPADQHHYGSTATKPETVRGSIAPIPGSTVQVNGAPASVDASFNFSAETAFAAAGPTPIVARVTTPDGKTSSDVVTVHRLGKLTVADTFPMQNAEGVERGILLLIRFSNPIDRSSLVAGALRLTDPSGSEIAGATLIDRDVISFAPAAPLPAGTKMTFTVGTALKDLAGQSLETPHVLTFTATSSAPATARQLDARATAGCFTTPQTISGTASAAGARVRLEVDGVPRTTTAGADRKFSFAVTFSDIPGFHLVRVQEVGADGSLSPEAAVCYRLDCAGPQVVATSLDRAARTLTIQFSRAMKLSSLTLGGTLLVSPAVTGTVALNPAGDTATITASTEFPAEFMLTVKKEVEDTSGRTMAADYTRSFTLSSGPPVEKGKGWLSGTVLDAGTGRPLAGATVTIQTPARAFSVSSAQSRLTAIALSDGTPTTSDRGRYTAGPLAEGPYTIEVSKSGYTTVWRQVVVPPGAGVVPIDIRLTPRASSGITYVDAQSLAGLLPLGWSPIGAAEVVDPAATSLTFNTGTITRALTAVRYDADRDEWRVIAAASNATVAITGPGNYALVYPDDAPTLAKPPQPVSGAALQGVANPCLTSPATCSGLTAVSFSFEPKQILPTQSALATLLVDGTKSYPSGIAVQAYIDEVLNFADGRTVIDPPFATDLLLYRTLEGSKATAQFRLAPTTQAQAAVLRDGVENVRIVDYPGRVDRGALIGPEGGRVPSDGSVSIEIPTGAVTESVHASVAAIKTLPTITGFRVTGGFTFTTGGVTLLKPARATFAVQSSGQIILAEELPNTPYGMIYRLASQTQRIGDNLYSTINSQLLDGIIREGRYFILVPENAIAFAHGTVVFGTNAPAANARVSTTLGVADLTRLGGNFVIPVPATTFTLTPRHTTTGDGASYNAATAPEKDAAVNVGTLTLAAQPPVLKSVTPSGEIDATAGLVVNAEFDRAIDPASVSGGITVTGLTGNVTAAGNIVTFTATTPLVAGTRYSITIAPTIRSTSGAPFGRTHVAQFSTRAIPATGTFSIKPDLIRITIPDTAGRSAVSGLAGAITGPSRYQLVPTRRGRAFVTQYQTTIDSGAAFTIAIGDGGADRITTTDAIDLRVVDLTSLATVAVVPLTPFVTADGSGFLAPVGVTTKFSLADGTSVSVPAGAFDQPTLITLAKAAKEEFAAVPNFDAELNFAAGIKLDFAGLAKKPLEIEIPVPAGLDTTNRTFVLGHLGESVRGPRIMIVDTLRVANGKFTTAEESTSSAKQARIMSSTLFGEPVKKHLLRTIESGRFTAIDIRAPEGSSVGWGVIDGLQGSTDLFFDKFHSLYASHLYMTEGRGRVVIPMLSGVAFTVEGVDAATGLASFKKEYRFDSSTPGFAAVLPSPDERRSGPYPIFGSPFRVESIDLVAEEIDLTSVRGYTVKLTGGGATISGTPTPTVLNVTKGLLGSVGATRDDRLVLLIPETSVDPASDIRVVFNIPIALPAAATEEESLRTIFSLQQCTAPGACGDITAQPKFAIDNSRRVVTITPAGELQRGATYRLRLSRNIEEVVAAGAPARKLAQLSPATTLPDDLYLTFSVREPRGSLGTTTIASGVIRDLALDGNLLFVSALEGGLQAFDASNPASLSGTPMATAPVPPGGESWAVVTDRHGRVFSTALSTSFGVVRSYRWRDFIAGGEVQQRATTIVSWRPGTTTYTTLSDRPEATPRKLQIASVDEEKTFETRAAFETALAAPAPDNLQASAVAGPSYGEFKSYTVTIPREAGTPYRVQPATVENLTLALRWSADAVDTQPAVIQNVLVRAGDRVRISRSRAAYGVVALFGYGVGVVDLNAMESNAWPNAPASYTRLSDFVEATSASITTSCTSEPCPIRDLTFSPESAITPAGEGSFGIVSLEPRRGMLDLTVRAVPDPETKRRIHRNGDGLVLTTPTTPPVEHPRLKTLRDRTRGANLVARFGSIARFAAAGRPYALVAAAHYGLLVFDLSKELTSESLADIIWVPAGAWGVRVVSGSPYAVVVDGAGRTLLVDLRRIDERAFVTAPLCMAADCETRLFPTVAAAISGAAAPGATTGFGVDDPRILWKSSPNGTATTLPPVADPDTGIIFSGQILSKVIDTIHAVDPKLRIKADLGAGLVDIGSIVPLGAGSQAAFRVETCVPAGAAPVKVAVESERVLGALAEQTPAPLPKSRLGEGAPRPTTVTLEPMIPAAALAANPELKFQRGANQFSSKWIVALADPRASKEYNWGAATAAEKEAAGCFSCERPSWLPADVLELYALGRSIVVRPESVNPAYNYLAGRMEARVSTVPADTVRPTHVLSAAQNPPFAGGAVQTSVLLHSGELVESRIDLDAGGRAGWNVIFDRTYRSRTLGGTPLGPGWESSIFRRLRPLPNGDVEYRDGSGEQWRFLKSDSTSYASPAGLELKLSRTESGWVLRDPKQRITSFDNFGRLVSESDVFFDGLGGGNIIRYLYDSSGRLATIVDPVGRRSVLEYYPDGDPAAGLLRRVIDWRGRAIDYRYDAQGRLASVSLPKTRNTEYLEFDHSNDSTRPVETYGYQTAGAGYNSALELATNLRTIQEPGDPAPRVAIDYYDTGNKRDMVSGETWGTVDGATVTYNYTIDSPLKTAYEAVVVDALKQSRTYSISALHPSDYFSERVHIDQVVEAGVPVWAATPFGELPPAVWPATTETTAAERKMSFSYGAGGRVEHINRSTSLGGISLTSLGYTELYPVGAVVTSRSITPSSPGMTGITQSFAHAGAFLTSVTSDGEEIQMPEPHRGLLKPKQADGGVTSEFEYTADGLLSASRTLPPAAPAAGTGATAEVKYHEANDPLLHRRGMPRKLTAGADLSVDVDYSPGPDTELRNAPRGVQTRIDYDELRRPIHVKVSGAGSIAPEEWFAYDARGRLVRYKRRQSGRDVEERYEYDVLGRLTRASLQDGAAELEATKYEYRLPDRLMRTILPAGGTITEMLDGAGRVTERITDPLHPFATATSEKIRYDGDDNVVFVTDGREAVATRYDLAGRPVETLRSDGTRSTLKIDGWGRLREAKDLASGALLKADYTPGGKLRQLATNTMTVDLGWDGAGRTRSVVTRRGAGQPVTQSLFEYDTAGRLLESKAGASDGTALTRLFSESKYFYGSAEVPSTVTTAEDGGAVSRAWSLDHDMLGQPVRVGNLTSPGFAFEHPRDEAGNVISVKTPARPGTVQYQHDARGNVTEEQLPSAAKPNRYHYAASGALERYLDPEDEETKVTSDGLGRPVLRTYPDGSTEEIHYEGDRVSEVRDRQGRRRRFVYNIKGQLEQITDGTSVIEELSYDPAGRLIGWKSGDTKIELADFDAEGRPQTTRQIRYRADGTPLDVYTQKHTYNGTGERTSWTMPSPVSTSAAWTTTVYEERDAMGNLIAIRRSASGASTTLMTAEFRDAGRPKERRVIAGAGPNELLRQYSYDDETGLGRLTEMQVFSGGQLIAGSRVTWNGLLRASEQQLGVAGGERFTSWAYDDRGRLTGMIAGTSGPAAVPLPGVPGSVLQGLTDAGFMTEIARTPATPAGALSSVQFTPKPGGGHKVGTVTRGASPAESVLYQKADGTEGGSVRTEDGRFRYEWDTRGNLRSVTEKILSPAQPTLTRVVYSYNAFDRMIGRRVEVAALSGGAPPAPTDWKLSTETSTAPGALPPSVTFVWDPLSDQLVAMFEAEKYESGSVVTSGRPLRQFIHGGLGLDDPIEVAVADPNAPNGVKRLYPILDEAGAGSLQAVVGESGELVA
ncbi:MAG TPA: Ig-like domain-containing protein, partial [Thermoanaerobaculia bacterium]|nr:Ig-like domain-containing protein [Thermoanaerobaculia bacterium]